MTKVVTDVIITPQPDKVVTVHEDLGTFVNKVDLLPYIKSRDIRFKATGLKPTTRVYAFFGSKPVSAWVAQDTKTFGDPLVTDATGSISGTFTIPPKTYTADSIEFMLVDVDDLTTGASTISTRAVATYHGSRLAVSSENITLDFSFSVPQIPIIEVVYGNITTTGTGTPSTGTGTPSTGTPSTGTPSTGTPATGTPATGTPATGTPATGTQTPVDTCFTGDSLVTMANGSLKRIDEVKIGEFVATPEGNPAQVIGIENPIVGERGLLGINGGKAFATADHIFKSTGNVWIVGDAGLSQDIFPSFNEIIEQGGVVKQIEVGDVIETDNGPVTVVSFNIEGQGSYSEVPVYDLMLDDESEHTYFVNGFVVHNCTPWQPPDTTGGGDGLGGDGVSSGPEE